MTQTLKPTTSRRFFYGWVVVGAGALVMVVGTVPLFQGMTAWFVVLEKQFGWSRTQLSIAFSLTRVEGSIMGPVAGYLVDKLGPRTMVALGLIIAGGGFLILSVTNSIWHLYLAFLVMSMGTGLGGWLPVMTAVNNWFFRRRATAMAIAMEGFLIGGVVLVPVLAWAIDPDIAGRPGWRGTAAVIGIFLMVIALPLARLVRNSPEAYGQRPDGQSEMEESTPDETPVENAEEPSYTWQEAVRTKAFWFITMGHACSSIVIVTMMVHLGPMLNDRGFSLQTVGWVVATYTAVGAIFTIDRRVRRRPCTDPVGDFRLFCDPICGCRGTGGGRHRSYGLRIWGALGHRLRWQKPVDDRYPGRLLWPQSFRQHHWYLHGSDECTSAGFTSVRGHNVRRHRHLYGIFCSGSRG